MGETEEKEPEGKKGEAEGSGKEDNNSEKTPVVESVPHEEEKKKIDLNETAKKQGLMTDDEFQSILDGVHRREGGTNEMAEGLDLASKSAGECDHSEIATEHGSVTHQSVEEMEEKESEEEKQDSEISQSEVKEDEEKAEKETKVQPKKQETTDPIVTKPKAVKRKLVLKRDPRAEGKKPRRVSQRCLGKWASSKAGSNTAGDAVELSSEEERTSPTKPG